jgi:hypothetical protein
LYSELIKDPVAICDLEEGLKTGSITTPELFANRFLRMVRNAKSFNREGSIIYKDANRLLLTFQHALKQEMNYTVHEDDDDPDEEESWALDLRERPQFAQYEREAYAESQAALAKARSTASKSTENAAGERDYARFLSTALDIKACRFSPPQNVKELHREELRKELSSLSISEKDSSKSHHNARNCLVCSVPVEHTAVTPHHSSCKHLGSLVFTPKYREIKPPQPKPTTPRQIVAPLSTGIEPALRKSRKRSDEHFSLDSEEERNAKKLSTRLTGPKQHHNLRNHRRASSPDSVAAGVSTRRKHTLLHC